MLKVAGAKAVLPDNGRFPPGILQLLAVAPVARNIGGELLLPEFPPGPLKLNWIGDIGVSLFVLGAGLFYRQLVKQRP